MNPENIPLNALIVGRTNSGKTRYLVRSLSQEFREKKFDYVILLYPTYEFDFFVFSPQQDQINDWSNIVSFVSEGANSLIILDECAALKDVKGRTNELVNLAFRARHGGLSVRVLTQQLTEKMSRCWFCSIHFLGGT